MKNIKKIKCVVWDLDRTLWDGVLLEGDTISLRPGIKNIIRTLDSRGILHSIASKNDYDTAMEKLREFELDEYFLYPEISWNAKSSSISRIQANLNIGMDSILFIDDQPFERDEVKSEHPEVTCFDARDYTTLPDHPRLNPRFITEDSAGRRQMYLEQIKRTQAEEQFVGPRKEFLASLQLRFAISKATENDLRRAEELTVRTNQLNTTGRTYDYDELKELIHSPHHELYVCELQDKYGYHGKIGLALLEVTHDCYYIRLFIMSCRVISMGVGTVLLSYIMNKAKQSGKMLRANFRRTGRNRAMYITFRTLNFKEIGSDSEGNKVLQNDLSIIPRYPPYLDLALPEYIDA